VYRKLGGGGVLLKEKTGGGGVRMLNERQEAWKGDIRQGSVLSSRSHRHAVSSSSFSPPLRQEDAIPQEQRKFNP
jgi:hypothetical protein